MSIYKSYSPEQMQEHLSNFILDSWTYSRVSGFARHQMAFAMRYIYGIKDRNSASAAAGSAYHEGLRGYFESVKEKFEFDIINAQAVAYDYIDAIKPNQWKLQTTTPTVEACQQEASKIVTALLENAFQEMAVYTDDIKEILAVELKGDEFVSVNGVDIPLPLHYVIDLVVRTKRDTIAIIDHKSKKSFTDEEELAMTSGIQAITYVLAYEEYSGQTVDEVWFIENKYSKNKDKSPQLRASKVTLDENTRRLYQAMLYDPLKAMLMAIQDPDHVYLINDYDTLVKKSDIYNFWCRMAISEVEDFDIEESKKELVRQRLKKVKDSGIKMITPDVIKKFQANAAKFIDYNYSNKNMSEKEKIEHALRSFGVIVEVAYTFDLPGQASNTYLMKIQAGQKVDAVFKYRLDVANAMDVENVRFSKQLVRHEGRSYLAVDISKKRDGILYSDPSLLRGLRIPLGRDNYGNIIFWDLHNHSTPHMLICGATGSGKSVCIRNIIDYCGQAPEITNIVVFDPKHEFRELQGRKISVHSEVEAIEEVIMSLITDMNDMVKNGVTNRKTLVVFDEMADAIAQSRSDTLEENLRILLQKGRSSGFRIIGATQRASAKVITGDAKVNFPVQICFRVPKEVDSRVVLDEPGAESLSGYGDGLIRSPEYPDTVRFQAFMTPAVPTVLIPEDAPAEEKPAPKKRKKK